MHVVYIDDTHKKVLGDKKCSICNSTPQPCGKNNYSLGYYLPKRKPLSTYISDECAYISDLPNRPENEWFIPYGALRIGGQAIGTSLVHAEMSIIYMERGFHLTK